MLVVPYYTIVDHCALPAGNRLFLMLNDLLCLFNLESLDIDKQQKLDTIGTMFVSLSIQTGISYYMENWIFLEWQVIYLFNGNFPAKIFL